MLQGAGWSNALLKPVAGHTLPNETLASCIPCTGARLKQVTTAAIGSDPDADAAWDIG